MEKNDPNPAKSAKPSAPRPAEKRGMTNPSENRRKITNVFLLFKKGFNIIKTFMRLIKSQKYPEF